MTRDNGGPVHPGSDAIKIQALYTDLFDAMRAKDDARMMAILRDLIASHQPGMFVRDYFAGQVLAGMCAVKWTSADDGPEVARRAYAFADAMLAERARTQEPFQIRVRRVRFVRQARTARSTPHRS